jgi:Ca2+-binding RTX toxin-like protein
MTTWLAMVCLGVALTAPGAAPVSASAATDTCFGQPATILGTDAAETLTGTTGADVIIGLRGNDTITGLGGDDVLCGGKGADVLAGGKGDDKLSGGLDDVRDVVGDGYFVDFGDTLVPGPGND